MSFVIREFTAQEALLLNLASLGVHVSCIPRDAGWLYAVDDGRNATFIPLEPEFLNGRDGYADALYVLAHEHQTFIFKLDGKRLVARARRDIPPRQVKLLEDLANEAYQALNQESEVPKIILIDTRGIK